VWHAGLMSDLAGRTPINAPNVGVVVARGVGYGAVAGGLAAVFIAPVTDLVTFTDDRFDPASILLAVLTAPVGAVYGLVAGLGCGAVVAFLPAHRQTPTVARWTAALVGPAIVALIGWWLFRPSLTFGENETPDHAVETLVIAYIYPCTAAFIIGLIGGPRLVAPVTDGDARSRTASAT